MNSVRSVLFLGLFMLHLFLRTGYSLYWETHQQKIAEQFCENKARPEMKCHGKCQLKKNSIAEEPASTEKEASAVYVIYPESTEEINLYSFCFARTEVTADIPVGYHSPAFPQVYATSVFRPPCSWAA